MKRASVLLYCQLFLIHKMMLCRQSLQCCCQIEQFFTMYSDVPAKVWGDIQLPVTHLEINSHFFIYINTYSGLRHSIAFVLSALRGWRKTYDKPHFWQVTLSAPLQTSKKSRPRMAPVCHKEQEKRPHGSEPCVPTTNSMNKKRKTLCRLTTAAHKVHIVTKCTQERNRNGT